MKSYRLGRWLRPVAILLLLALVAGEIGIAINIWRRPNPTLPAAPTDVAIVLGAAVWRNQPSPVFAARIDYALDLLKAGQVNYIIFTGGVGSGDQLAESVAAAQYAVAHGVSPDRLRCEEIFLSDSHPRACQIGPAWALQYNKRRRGPIQPAPASTP